VDTIDGLILPTITALAETASQLYRGRQLHRGNLDENPNNIKHIQPAAARTAAVPRSSPILERVSEVWAELIHAAIARDVNVTGNEKEQPLSNAARALGLNSP
jgi:hypothetical protein